MTKTEYTAAIATTQTAISTLRTDLRKLRAIEKLSQSFPDLKLVDASILETSITEKKAELTKLRSELSKARRIVKRMAEIEDIETGKADEPKAKTKKPAAEKKAGTTAKKSTEKKGDGATKKKATKKADSTTAQAEAGKTEQPAPTGETKENAAA